MRLIFGLIALILIVLVAAPVIRYGTADPCRMLAQDIADESYGQIADVLGVEKSETPEGAKAMARMMTSNHTQSECVSQLSDRWWQRITE
jgi:deoxycytidylate deaminase